MSRSSSALLIPLVEQQVRLAAQHRLHGDGLDAGVIVQQPPSVAIIATAGAAVVAVATASALTDATASVAPISNRWSCRLLPREGVVVARVDAPAFVHHHRTQAEAAFNTTLATAACTIARTRGTGARARAAAISIAATVAGSCIRRGVRGPALL